MNKGVKQDHNKIDPSIVPSQAILAIAVGLMFGAKKYERNNHKKIENGGQRFTSAAYRHLLAHIEGMEEGHLAIDEESNLPHIVLSACSLVVAMYHYAIDPKELLANMKSIECLLEK
jgi:Domain of unknown function (DUF5664)